jgi:Protein of unknown function (DUF1236)
MTRQVSLWVAAAVLLAGASAASAAGMQTSTSTRISGTAADSLNLNRIQQKVAWAELARFGARQKAPSSFTAAAGTVVPSSVKVHPVGKKVARDVPALRPYDFALVRGRLLIVNPSDRKVTEVIRKGSFFR